MATGFPIIFEPRLWTPAEISTGAWFDAQDLSSIVLNGTTVSQWSDKSGNGRNATNTTAAQQPTFVQNAVLGNPSLSFDASDDQLNFDGTFLAGTSYTVAAVFSRTSTKISNYFLGGTVAANNSQLQLGFSANTTYYYGQFGNDITTTVAGYTATVPMMTLNQLNTASGRLTRINGTDGGTSASTVTLTAFNGARIGAGSSGRFLGHVHEIFITTTAPAAAERFVWEGYLAWKWNIVNLLPDTHPYKNSPPTV